MAPSEFALTVFTICEFCKVLVQKLLSCKFGEVVISKGVPAWLVGEGTHACVKGRLGSRGGSRGRGYSAALLAGFIHTLLGGLRRVGWGGAF